jgi:hypothetical protein
MNNEPVAWMHKNPDHPISKNWSQEYNIPLYTHPAKPLSNVVVSSATCSCGKVMQVTNLQEAKTLTDEEILQFRDKVPYSLGSDLIDFARAILRKAQEK